MKSNIVLIGMSGAGKSTVGMALSYKLKMPFVDMDNYIERKEKMTIDERKEKCYIFNKEHNDERCHKYEKL